MAQIDMVAAPTEGNHVLRKRDIEVPLFLYNETRDYSQGDMVVDLDSRWFFYCVRDCPAGTILDDDNYFMPLPDDVAKERVSIHIENLSAQISGSTVEFTTTMDISDKYFKLFLNGIYQSLDTDYVVTGAHTIKMLYGIPFEKGDILTVEFYTVVEKSTEYGQIEIITENLSPQINQVTGNMLFNYSVDRVDCVNIFWNGIRLRQGQDNDYQIDRLNKQIAITNADITNGDLLIMEIYTPPVGAERRLIKQDIDLSPEMNGTVDVFDLGRQRVGDTYNLFYNGIKLTKDLDYFLDLGQNTIQTQGWAAQVDDALILEVYKMI